MFVEWVKERLGETSMPSHLPAQAVMLTGQLPAPNSAALREQAEDGLRQDVQACQSSLNIAYVREICCA